MKKLFKKPNWLKPEINQLKYHFHLMVLAVMFEILWLAFGSLVPWAFGFAMPALTWNLLASIIFSPLTIVIYVILLISDIIAHTVLQLD